MRKQIKIGLVIIPVLMVSFLYLLFLSEIILFLGIKRVPIFLYTKKFQKPCRIELSEIKELKKRNIKFNEPYIKQKDFDGDKILDTFIDQGRTFTVKLSKGKITIHKWFPNISEITNGGFDDINSDGILDIWYYNWGDWVLNYYIGLGNGKIKTVKKIIIPRNRRYSYLVFFRDIDSDGKNELITTNQEKSKFFYYEIKSKKY